jgi:hypothetical protein
MLYKVEQSHAQTVVAEITTAAAEATIATHEARIR